PWLCLRLFLYNNEGEDDGDSSLEKQRGESSARKESESPYKDSSAANNETGTSDT
ncbi:hypothetical protein HAX54_022501, partial [Datura stramonium]|nr:hypothetical protein [Datura stramonium]